MKKTFISLLSSVLISLSLIGGSAFANEEATSTLTVTETPVMPQIQEVVIPEQQPTTQSNELPEESQQTESQSSDTSTSDQQELPSSVDETNTDTQDTQSQDGTEEDGTDENNVTDDNDTSDSHDQSTDEYIEISETEAQTLSADENQEYEVMSVQGKRMKKKHHHNHDCNHNPIVNTGSTGSLDLWIRKGSYINGTTTGNVGDIVNYIITYGNGGSITATGVTITDTFPVGFVSTSSGTPRTTVSGNTYTITLGTLHPGDSGQVLFTGIVLTGSESGSLVTNTAAISATTYEDAILLGNNIASADVTVFGTGTAGTGGTTTGGIADAYVQKTASITTGNVGDTFTYTLTYGNSGNAIATGITLYEQFPAAVSGDLSAWTNVGGNVWKITLPDMNPGFVGTVSITGVLIQGATFGANILNLAQIQTLSLDSNPANNTSFVELQSFSGSNNCNCNGKNALKGTVYVDTLRNNVYNAGSDGTLPAITVNLYVNGILTHTTMTDGNGLYSFGSLVDGTYQVQYVVPGTYTPVVSNVGDKGGLSTNNTTLSSIVLSGGIVSAENNFGLIREGNGGYAGGGGGGYTIPVPPTPTTPVVKDPIIPIGPTDEIPLPTELLESGPDLVGTLQEVIPTLPVATSAIKAEVEQKATEVVITFAHTMPQTLLFVQHVIPQRPLLYVDILGGFNQYMYAILMNLVAILAATGIGAMSIYVFHTIKNRS